MRYFVVLMILAGCATPEERAERAMARHGPYCEQFGFERGTDRWLQCVMLEEESRRGRRGTVCAQSGNAMVCR